MLIGQGYDAHRFAPGTPLVLGGVRIEHPQGLAAHSDGDVIIHALCDALLGAAGLGDIGRHFPDNDAKYRGIDSRVLLRRVVDLLRQEGLRAHNADLTAVAVPRSLFMHLVEESQLFSNYVFKFFSQRIVQLMELIEELAWDKMRSRLAAMLVERPDALETTHQRLADELGSVREVISRTLKRFEEKGFVKLGRGQLQILDREGLQRTAGL